MTEQKYEHEIATVNSRIDRIEVTLNHAVDAIEKIVDVVNKPEETKWGPILTAVGLLFMAAGGYTTLVTTPMKSRIEHLGLARSELALDTGHLGARHGGG